MCVYNCRYQGRKTHNPKLKINDLTRETDTFLHSPADGRCHHHHTRECVYMCVGVCVFVITECFQSALMATLVLEDGTRID